MAIPQHIIQIIQKRRQSLTLTERERVEIRNWFSGGTDDTLFGDKDCEEGLFAYLQLNADEKKLNVALERFKAAARLNEQDPGINGEMITPLIAETSSILPAVGRVQFLRPRWLRYAAILLLIAGTAALVYQVNQPKKDITYQQSSKQPTDILPGGNKATLTLADGSQIALDTAANGRLTEQGTTKIVKLNAGALTYQGGTPHDEVLYNTISTPKGGQYQISLPDGTRVWLNAASSIRFPTVFVKDRSVVITGEVYFEVAGNTQMPFRVNVDNLAEVRVLGTSFDIKAYPDEDLLKATLLQGAVQLIANSKTRTLSPGEQLQLSNNGRMDILPNADVNQVIGWKNGLFNFNGSDIKSIMNEIGRWYDLEVIYEAEPKSQKIMGEMERNLTLSQVMIVLRKLNISYRLEGRKLIITK